MEKAAVSIALSAVRDLLFQEARFLYGVRSDVRGLQIQLQGIQCVLDDADRRKLESKSLRHWVTQIKDIAHRAEDIILTYAVQVSSRRGRSIKQRLCRFSCILNECYSVHQIGSEISEIKSDLDTIQKMYEYGLRNIIEGGSSSVNPSDNQQWERLAFPFETGDCFVGKEEELKQLMSLMTEEKQHRIIALWGTGGIGKTTIARKLYNHIDARHCFECFAWVCVTQNCKVRPVLEDVLQQLTPQPQGKDHISTLSNIELLTKLREIQTAKRCMIVLDDIWQLSHWDCLKPAFLIQGSKSKILLTTRNQNVANIGYAFEVGHLNLDDGWELL